jgi:exopolysaccharide production protein ExoY
MDSSVEFDGIEVGLFMAGGDESMYALDAATIAAGDVLGSTDSIELKAPADNFTLLRGFYWRVKRPLGLAFAAAAMILGLPAMLVIALILAHQGRPVFIRRQRLGQFGRPFTSYHFRTMAPDSLRSLDLNLADHPPIKTDAFGRMLARTRLDRLPLLWNVLKGDMNLVGPRPLSQEELIGSGRAARYSLSVRPGVTGLWWVDGEHDLRRRLASDRSYIDRAGPLLDLRILARTVAHMHGV